MRLRDHYDWIVLGNDPGALLSASLATKIGLSVLVLPLVEAGKACYAYNERPGIKMTSDEFLLDGESNYILGLGAGGLWSECLKQVGMVEQEQSLIYEKGATPQIMTPHFRVSLWSDRERFAAELRRELGHSGFEKIALMNALCHADEAIEGFWLKLPDRLTLNTPKARKVNGALTIEKLSDQLSRSLDRRKAPARSWLTRGLKAKQWSEENQHIDLPEFFEGVESGLVGSVASAEQKLFDVLHLLSVSRTGASFKGGMSAFREFLFRLARRNGADIPSKIECKRIFIQDGKFAGVLPSTRGSMIGASGGVVGVPLQEIHSLLTTSGRSLWRKLKTPRAPVGWKFTLAVALPVEGIPPGLSQRMTWQEEGAPFLEMELAQPTDYGLKDRKRVVMLLRTILPITEESLIPAYQRLIAARVLRKATELLPFLEFHISRIFPDFRAEDGRELSEIYGFKAISAIPSDLLCYSGQGLGAHSGVEGLFLSSQESFPRLGGLGTAVSALEGVAWIALRSGLSGPLKQSSAVAGLSSGP